ncbi:CocE/NonD family hydrolase [Amycolatopsis taiwanensis]|uniref:CocE/NonD family hydrolase n=1 Tax=Amycolatopsis taiwanensis TaxID=342230 RepID=UPI000483D5E9|nr:CocE/NonD family hydrolase [Amycolatopsis taiwanensis]
MSVDSVPAPAGRRARIIDGMTSRHGYHLLLVRCRGTFGSGGTWQPWRHEIDDGADTVAWLRTQPWFDGQLARAGNSYLGWTQWALLMEPPPELVAAVIQTAPHDFSQSAYFGGAFDLSDWLDWSEQPWCSTAKAASTPSTRSRSQTV